MGVEPTICLLAKQMPLPHSSHGPIKARGLNSGSHILLEDPRRISHMPGSTSRLKEPSPTSIFGDGTGTDWDLLDD